LQLPIESVEQQNDSTLKLKLPPGVVILAYLWEETPIEVPLAAPIYADGIHHLPSAPWKWLVTPL